MFDRYVVKNGDTLKSIAYRFNTNESTLQEINSLFDDSLRVGKELIVPNNKDNYFNYYTIEKGDSLYKIGKEYNINPDLLAALNGLNKEDYIYPGQEILVPKGNYSYYVTAEGDTLDLVVNRFKTNPDMFFRYNETIYLMPGQLLVNKNR